MIVYLDSSVLLRLVLGQRDALAEWKQVDAAVASALVEVECLRSLDRLRLIESLSDREVTSLRQSVFRVLERCEIVGLARPVLSRASQPFPVSLKTLDALHLATALLYRETRQPALIVATHDATLAQAARSVGISVIGA